MSFQHDTSIGVIPIVFIVNYLICQNLAKTRGHAKRTQIAYCILDWLWSNSIKDLIPFGRRRLPVESINLQEEAVRSRPVAAILVGNYFWN